MERKGASYRITDRKPAEDPNNMVHGGRRPNYSNVAAAMDIRKREYERAEAGQMTQAEMSRVGIDYSKYPGRLTNTSAADVANSVRPVPMG